jgi:phosphoglycerate dehydrogenase-like enzyme
VTGKLVLTYECDAAHVERLRARAPGWNIVAVESESQAIDEFAVADVVFGNRYFLQALPAARKLQWMQSNSVGMDVLLASPMVRDRKFLLTNARGVYDLEIADHALAMILAVLRGLPASERARAEGRWERRPLRTIAGTKGLVFGYGGVGREICRRLRMCGAQVTAVRRRAQQNEAADDEVVGLHEGMERLADADIVVLALPLTAETEKVFDAQRIDRLKQGSVLVNIARGALIDESALERALERLGGVALDTLCTEPPPAGHWAWRHPKVLLTPHLARAPEAPDRRRFYPLFERNLERWARGLPPVNVVDRHLGY